MNPLLIAAIACMTYASRALAVVLMPQPTAPVRAVLERIPAPLFASLAALLLFDSGALARTTTLLAAAGAVLVSPTRSLLVVLMAGLAGYALGALLGV